MFLSIINKQRITVIVLCMKAGIIFLLLFNSDDISPFVENAHHIMDQTNHAHDPFWVSEWVSYLSTDKYDTVSEGIGIISDLIRGSLPDDDYVYGNDIFALYDYGTAPYGLISSTIDLSALLSAGTGMVKCFDRVNRDNIREKVQLIKGKIVVKVPPDGAVLVQFP